MAGALETEIAAAIGCKQEPPCAACHVGAQVASGFDPPFEEWTVGRDGKHFAVYGFDPEGSLVHVVSGDCCATTVGAKKPQAETTEEGHVDYTLARLGYGDKIEMSATRIVTDLRTTDEVVWKCVVADLAQPIELTVRHGFQSGDTERTEATRHKRFAFALRNKLATFGPQP